jgi:hypothetical protein
MTTHILRLPSVWPIVSARWPTADIAGGTLDDLRLQAGSGHASLEDTFLALVAQDAVTA